MNKTNEQSRLIKELREDRTEQFMALGFSREEAEKHCKQHIRLAKDLEAFNEGRKKYTPSEMAELFVESLKKEMEWFKGMIKFNKAWVKKNNK